MRDESGKHRGAPFTLIKAVPVDLFPGTKHCELVLLFERGNQQSLSNEHSSESDNAANHDKKSESDNVAPS